MSDLSLDEIKSIDLGFTNEELFNIKDLDKLVDYVKGSNHAQAEILFQILWMLEKYDDDDGIQASRDGMMNVLIMLTKIYAKINGYSDKDLEQIAKKIENEEDTIRKFVMHYYIHLLNFNKDLRGPNLYEIQQGDNLRNIIQKKYQISDPDETTIYVDFVLSLNMYHLEYLEKDTNADNIKGDVLKIGDLLLLPEKIDEIIDMKFPPEHILRLIIFKKDINSEDIYFLVKYGISLEQINKYTNINKNFSGKEIEYLSSNHVPIEEVVLYLEKGFQSGLDIAYLYGNKIDPDLAQKYRNINNNFTGEEISNFVVNKICFSQVQDFFDINSELTADDINDYILFGVEANDYKNYYQVDPSMKFSLMSWFIYNKIDLDLMQGLKSLGTIHAENIQVVIMKDYTIEELKEIKSKFDNLDYSQIINYFVLNDIRLKNLQPYLKFINTYSIDAEDILYLTLNKIDPNLARSYFEFDSDFTGKEIFNLLEGGIELKSLEEYLDLKNEFNLDWVDDIAALVYHGVSQELAREYFEVSPKFQGFEIAGWFINNKIKPNQLKDFVILISNYGLTGVDLAFLIPNNVSVQEAKDYLEVNPNMTGEGIVKELFTNNLKPSDIQIYKEICKKYKFDAKDLSFMATNNVSISKVDYYKSINLNFNGREIAHLHDLNVYSYKIKRFNKINPYLNGVSISYLVNYGINERIINIFGSNPKEAKTRFITFFAKKGAVELYNYLENNNVYMNIKGTKINIGFSSRSLNLLRGVLNIVGKKGSKIPSATDKQGWESVFKEFENNINDYLDKESDFDKIYYIYAHPKYEDNNLFARGHQEYLQILKNLYGEETLIDFSTGSNESDKINMPQDIIEHIKKYHQENPDHKVGVFIGLHSTDFNQAVYYNKGNITKDHFEQLVNISSNISLDLNSCSAKSKFNQEEDLSGNVLMSSNLTYASDRYLYNLKKAFMGQLLVKKKDLSYEIPDKMKSTGYFIDNGKSFYIDYSKDEIDNILKIKGNILSRSQLEEAIDKSIRVYEADYDGDGKVSYNEAVFYTLINYSYSFMNLKYINDNGKKIELL